MVPSSSKNQQILFADLLHSSFLQNLTENIAVFWITSSVYPAFFLKELDAKIKQIFGQGITTLSVSNEQSLNALIEATQVSFLGQRCCYLATEAIGVDQKISKSLLSYLKKYTGPHTLIYSTQVPFTSSEQTHKFCELPQSLSAEEYKKLFTWVYGQESSSVFARYLVEKHAPISVEEALSLMRYQIVIGKNTNSFFQSYLPYLIKGDETLFLLAQYFFSGDIKKFFAALTQLEQVYPLEFWVVFWLEQIWQALVFVDLAIRIGPIAAKAQVIRLPFSFLQQDWKKYKLKELIEAHNKLYQFDSAHKNGASELGLHFWYVDFLTKKFKN